MTFSLDAGLTLDQILVHVSGTEVLKRLHGHHLRGLVGHLPRSCELYQDSQ